MKSLHLPLITLGNIFYSHNSSAMKKTLKTCIKLPKHKLLPLVAPRHNDPMPRRYRYCPSGSSAYICLGVVALLSSSKTPAFMSGASDSNIVVLSIVAQDTSLSVIYGSTY